MNKARNNQRWYRSFLFFHHRFNVHFFSQTQRRPAFTVKQMQKQCKSAD